jgi:hypothetical protein
MITDQQVDVGKITATTVVVEEDQEVAAADATTTITAILKSVIK